MGIPIAEIISTALRMLIKRVRGLSEDLEVPDLVEELFAALTSSGRGDLRRARDSREERCSLRAPARFGFRKYV